MALLVHLGHPVSLKDQAISNTWTNLARERPSSLIPISVMKMPVTKKIMVDVE